MTQYNDPQIDKEPLAETEPVKSDPGVKVYDRPARTTPIWMIALYVLAGLATLWFLFTYVF